jgi:SecD/SecF fusion protein
MKADRALLFSSLLALSIIGCSRNRPAAASATAAEVAPATLAKAPEHGTAFLLNFDAENIKADTNALPHFKSVIAKRFSQLGQEIFWEPVSVGQVRVIAAITNGPEIIAATNNLARGGLLAFRLVHEKSNDLIKEGSSEPGYELLKEKSRLADGTVRTNPCLVKIKPELTGQYLQNATLGRDQMGRPQIGFTFDANGATIFGRVTAENIGRRLAIVLDGEIQSAPRINAAIITGRGVISGNFNEDEAGRLVDALQSPLPFPITVTVEKTF